MFSNSNLRKYKDAILWGSSEANQPLPYSFYNEIGKFFKLFKKETKKAAKDGLLDFHEADPIWWNIFYFILQWALDKGSIFIWVFSVLQWNCMAQSINIGALAYHNFHTGDDYIKIRYDKTKSYQAGKMLETSMCTLTLSTLFVVQFSHLVFGFPWSRIYWGQIRACLVLQIQKKKIHLTDTHLY